MEEIRCANAARTVKKSKRVQESQLRSDKNGQAPNALFCAKSDATTTGTFKRSFPFCRSHEVYLKLIVLADTSTTVQAPKDSLEYIANSQHSLRFGLLTRPVRSFFVVIKISKRKENNATLANGTQRRLRRGWRRGLRGYARHFRRRGSLRRRQLRWEFYRPAGRLLPSAEIN